MLKDLLKKYWWIIVTIIVLPKFVDWLFSWHLCNLTEMQNLEASDIMTYLNNIILILLAFVSFNAGIKQYRLLNRTFIVPCNKSMYFYSSESFGPSFLYDSSDVKIEEFSSLPDKEKPIITELKNIGKGVASEFRVICNYKKGEYFYELMALLGYENYAGFKSNFEPANYYDCGVFNADESKNWELPDTIKNMIRHICVANYTNQTSKDPQKLTLNNCLIRKKYKIATIQIFANDILDLTKNANEFVYDLMIEIDCSMAVFTENSLFSTAKITFTNNNKRM